MSTEYIEEYTKRCKPEDYANTLRKMEAKLKSKFGDLWSHVVIYRNQEESEYQGISMCYNLDSVLELLEKPEYQGIDKTKATIRYEYPDLPDEKYIEPDEEIHKYNFKYALRKLNQFTWCKEKENREARMFLFDSESE
jgi:hypothetical protein